MTDTDRTCPRCSRPLPTDAPAATCPRCLLAAGFTSDDGAPAPEGLEPARIAPHFPELEILELLGRGGMGVVYKARQKSLDRLVALKILQVGDDRDPVRAAAFEDRFQREARALARLDHPHIVGVHEYGEREGLYFLIMEYVDGCNLREAMQLGGLSPEQAITIVPQICDALTFAHGRGVVHRDIKPENVLVAKDGHVKIADFGLAKLVLRDPSDATLTRVGQVMGTPHYMAPEQIESPTDVDHRADIYSLGVVFYEMLTGELPLGRFEAPSHKVAVDVRLDEVVLRALEKQPSRRYQTAADVKTGVEIAGTAAPRAPASTAASPPRPAPADAKVSKLAIAGVLGLPVAVVAAVLPGMLGGGMSIPVWAVVVLPLAIAFTGWMLSIAAWIRIHHSKGLLRGLAFAIIGTVLPPLACLPAGAIAFLGVRHEPVVETYDEDGNLIPDSETDGPRRIRMTQPTDTPVLDDDREPGGPEHPPR